MIFLIEYDRTHGTLLQLKRFAPEESVEANQARLGLELERMGAGLEREIVILEAVSEAQLRKTHRRYFESINSLVDPNTPLPTRKAA